MTAPKPSDPTTDRRPDKLGLSATQLIASGLAAMSATVVASFFGVAGTVIGAALGSMVAVVGNAVYGYSLRRTRSRVRQTLDVAVAHRFATEPARVIAQGEQAGTESSADAPAARFSLPLRPRRMALLAAGVCAVVLAVTTAFEFASGQPLSATVTGKHGSGVSVGGGTSKKASPSPSRPAPTSSTGGGSSGTGSVRPTVTVTVTPSGSATPTQSSAPASSEPAGSPSGSGSPTGSPAG